MKRISLRGYRLVAVVAIIACGSQAQWNGTQNPVAVATTLMSAVTGIDLYRLTSPQRRPSSHTWTVLVAAPVETAPAQPCLPNLASWHKDLDAGREDRRGRRRISSI